MGPGRYENYQQANGKGSIPSPHRLINPINTDQEQQVIATVRSSHEGGRFLVGPDAAPESIENMLQLLQATMTKLKQLSLLLNQLLTAW